MQITIFGASGKVGHLVVERALALGYTVVAFTHTRDLFVTNNRLRVVKGNIHNADDVAGALRGSQAVISCLGSWHTKSKDIVSGAMRTIIPAMEQQGIQRIVTLTGVAAFDEADVLPIGQKIAHGLMSLVAGKIVQDAEQHIKLLRASKLDWTVIRSPIMNNRGDDIYKLSSKLPKLFDTVSRTAVARALLHQLQVSDFVGKAPIIYRN